MVQSIKLFRPKLFKPAFWGLLIVGFGLTLLAQQVLSPQPAAAASTTSLVIVKSQPNEGSAKFLSYGDYGSYKNWVNWPHMSQGCGGSSNAYKKFAWLGDTAAPRTALGAGIAPDYGNVFNDSGNCNNIFSNGGQANVSSNGYPGAWADITSFGGWGVNGGSPVSLGGQVYNNTSSGLLGSCNFINGVSGTASTIWGQPNDNDHTDWANGAGISGFKLYSGGTTLYRRDFTLTDAEKIALTTGELHLQIAIDDFMSVYLNGILVTTPVNVDSWQQPAQLHDLTLDNSDLIVDGNNTIAIQMVDKAVWDTADPNQGASDSGGATSRGEGMCYGLTIQNITAPVGGSSSDCPGWPGQDITNVPVSLNQIAPDNNNPVPAYGLPYNNTITQDVPGDYEVTALPHDEWSPNPTDVTSISPGVGTRQSSNTFSLNYTNFWSQYRYDTHTPTVLYKQYYNETHWKADGAPVYANATCQAGERMGGDGNCYTGEYADTDIGNGAHDCNGGYGFFDPEECYSGRYTPTGQLLGYAYNSDNDTVEKTQTGGSQAAPTMPACYGRTFAVSASPTTPAWDDQEDPTSASYLTQVTVAFSLDHGASTLPLRQAAQIEVGGAGGLSNQSIYSIESYTGAPEPYTMNPASESWSGLIGTVPSPPGSITNPFSTTASTSAPPVQAGDMPCYSYSITQRHGEVDPGGNILPGSASGPPVTGNVCGLNAHNAPYVKVYGNDVWAGGGFADAAGNCSVTPGKIDTNIKTGGALPRGSSTQFAAMALSVINGFASADLRTTPPTSSAGLSFANTTGGYGGNSGMSTFCLPDYFALDSGASPLPPGGNDWQGSIPDGSYQYTGNLTLTVNSGTHVNAGNKTALFVDGDVWIKPVGSSPNGQIALSTSPTLQNVPSLYIVAHNIYIDGNISSLAGVYVAQPRTDGSGGIISTCADSGGTHEDFDACSHQLTVTGSFIAKQVDLDRTFASLRNSLGGEVPQLPASSAACALSGDTDAAHPPAVRRPANNYVCAAELFNFSPTTYLGVPALDPIQVANPDKFDYITSLPPVL